MATSEQIRELVEKLHAERAELFAVLKGVSEEEAERRRLDKDGEDGWSTKDILAHLCWQDATYRGWVTRAIEGGESTASSPPVDMLGRKVGAGQSARQGDGEAVPHYLELSHTLPLIELVLEMERQRARTMPLITELRPEDFDRVIHNPLFGDLTVLQYLRSSYRHERQHRAQILNEKSDYEPRYVGAGEPDQRLRRR